MLSEKAMRCHACENVPDCNNPPNSECGGDIQEYLGGVKRWAIETATIPAEIFESEVEDSV